MFQFPIPDVAFRQWQPFLPSKATATMDIQYNTESTPPLYAALPLRGGAIGESSPTPLNSVVSPRSKKGGNEDGDSPDDSDHSIFGKLLTHAAVLPPFLPFLKGMLGVTALLYVMNQSHLLPKPISGLVSRALFWPTLPITYSRRVGGWTTTIDDTVILGGAPFGFVGLPEKLHEEGVRGVVNFCEEYRGPARKYKNLGMTELRLPTTDHFEPSLDSLQSAVEFIESYKEKGERVYVHCRAGHGRSGAGVMAYLLAKDPVVDVQSLNEWLGMKRKVRRTLWKQQNLKQFHQKLLLKMAKSNAEDEQEGEDEQQQSDTGSSEEDL
jgi:atypical dual specificity phosphatase